MNYEEEKKKTKEEKSKIKDIRKIENKIEKAEENKLN